MPIVRFVGRVKKPTAGNVQVLELVMSDANKTLLLANSIFVPFLISGLFLDPDHPRAALKLWNQHVVLLILPPSSTAHVVTLWAPTEFLVLIH